MARTYTVTETPNSRKMQVQTPGVGSSVFTYEYTIRPTSGTEGTANEEYQAAYNALRTYLGVPIGKLTDISAFSQSPLGGFGSVRSINLEHDPDSAHIYRAVVTWQSEFPEIYTASDTDPLVVSGQAALNYTSQPALRFVDLYKKTALPTAAQQQSAATAGGLYHSSYLIDVSGTNPTYNSASIDSLDVAGRPVKYPVAQIEVTIDEPWANSTDLIQDTQLGRWPRWDGNASLMFKRNQAAFMHFPAGTLLYMGTTTTPRQFHTHTLSHRFIYDELGHFEQQTFQSLFDIANVSVIEDFQGTGINVTTQLEVFWINYYDVADFSAFSWANAATSTQVASGFVDWSGVGGAGPIIA